MRRRIAFMSIFGLIAATIARADDLPMKVSFDRYKGMLEHSPFAVATAVVAPAATPNFAKDLYVANAARSPDGDMVTVASMTDKEFKKQGDDQQGWSIRHAHVQSVGTVQTGAEQTRGCSCASFPATIQFSATSRFTNANAACPRCDSAKPDGTAAPAARDAE
jgi:hypothetical protein